MNWTVIFIILAAVFAGIAAIRQYAETSKVHVTGSRWNRFAKQYLNLTILFIILAGACACFASVIQYNENDKVSKKNDSLQAKLVNYAFGSNEVPALTGSLVGNKLLVSITNPDKEYAMYNVRVKCRETLYPDIGTLYPSVNKILDAIDISQNKGETWYFVIWYNNSKNLEADIELKTDSQGNKVINTTYLDEKEVQFTPPWKKRADSLMKIPDTAIHHYHPNQHS